MRKPKTQANAEIDRFVGTRIRERRAVLGMTQRELAEPLGVAPFLISKYEVGDIRVSASRLYEIARLLETYPEYFFPGFEDDPAPKLPTEQRLLPNFIRSLTQIESKAHLEALSHVVRVLRGNEQARGDQVRPAPQVIIASNRDAVPPAVAPSVAT